MRRPALIAIAAVVLSLTACKDTAPQSRPDAAQIAALNHEALQDPRRVLDLEGGVNFRDLGGYRTSDGRMVKWERLYRSGSPADLTEQDMAILAKRGIRSVCDLRSSDERAAEPSPFAAAAAGDNTLGYYTRDYAMSMGDLGKVLTGPDASPAATRAAMMASYTQIPNMQRENLAEMFRLLAAGRTPLAFNCSAGKDRTGIAAALILIALGVPRETVLADYALSDKLVDYRAQLQQGAAKSQGYAMLARLPYELVEPLMVSDPAYLESALAELERQYGSIDRFLERELGLTAEHKERIRVALTEAAT